MCREGTALTLFTGERFSIVQHHKVKQVIFNDGPVFPLTSVNLVSLTKKVAVIKGLFALYFHLYSFK